MNDVKLLPLPPLGECSESSIREWACACVEADRHAMQAEVGEARSERDRMFLSAREWAERFGQMEARAERLAEALRWIAGDDTAKGCDDGMQEVEALKQRARAALQEPHHD